MTTEQWIELIMPLAWGTPFGLGFGLISIGIFLWLLGKFFVSITEVMKNLKK